MTRRRTAPTPDQPSMARRWADNDAEFLAALRQAADHLVARGEPDPGLPTIVRIAADELERFYAAEMVAPSAPPKRKTAVDFYDILCPTRPE
jgi:hypothetical protein